MSTLQLFNFNRSAFDSHIRTVHEKQIQNHQIKLKFECTKWDAQFIDLTEVRELSKSFNLLYQVTK